MQTEHRLLATVIAVVCATSVVAFSATIETNPPMLDSAADKPGEEWCYLSKSTTVIGVPFQPDVTQITFDGSVYTRNAELCFFYGGKHQPFLLDGEAHAGPEPLSFDFVRKTFQYEYARRAAKAPKLVTIAAPAMLTAAERTQAFTRQFGVIPQDKVIAR